MYEVMPTCALGGRREPESALPCVPYGTQGRKGVNRECVAELGPVEIPAKWGTGRQSQLESNGTGRLGGSGGRRRDRGSYTWNHSVQDWESIMGRHERLTPYKQ